MGGQNIADKLAQKLNERNRSAGRPARSDLFISDLQAIDNSKCRVLVGYFGQREVPTIAQVEEFFHTTFGNKIVAQMSSAEAHPENSAISVLVNLNTPTRPLADINDMVKISNGVYMDDKTSNLWQVVDAGSNKYITRQSQENIWEIVQARKARHSNKDAKFATIKTAAPMALAGDTVKFMSPENVLLMGEVSTINDTKAKISANGQSYSIDRHSIIQIIDRASSNVQSDKSTLEDYFTKAYGSPEFAKQLTDKISTELHGLGATVPNSPGGAPDRNED